MGITSEKLAHKIKRATIEKIGSCSFVYLKKSDQIKTATPKKISM